MPDVHTQTPMAGNRIEKALEALRTLRQAKYNRTYKKKRAAIKRIGKRVVGDWQAHGGPDREARGGPDRHAHDDREGGGGAHD